MADGTRQTVDPDLVKRRWLLLSPALTLLIAGASGPLLIILLYSFLEAGDYGGVEWSFSLRGWFDVFLERDIFDDTVSFADANISILWRSIRLSLVTTIGTLLVGFPTAYFVATRSERARTTWLFLITIPFWSNLLIRTFAMREVLRNEGVINNILRGLGLIEEPIQLLFTDFAILVGMVYVFLPLMVLPIYASLERLDFRLIEAAYDLYASRWQVLRRVIIPLVRPGLVAGSILVFVPSLGAYVIPQLLGGGRRLMLGNLIALQFGSARNWPLGSALSLTMLLIVLLALSAYMRATRAEEDSDG